MEDNIAYARFQRNLYDYHLKMFRKGDLRTVKTTFIEEIYHIPPSFCGHCFLRFG